MRANSFAVAGIAAVAVITAMPTLTQQGRADGLAKAELPQSEESVRPAGELVAGAFVLHPEVICACTGTAGCDVVCVTS